MEPLSVAFTSESGSEAIFTADTADADNLAIVTKVTKKLCTGHESAQVNLARDPFVRFDDIDQLYQCEIVGPDGFQIFKGAVTGIPPESKRLQVNVTGNFSKLTDDKGCTLLGRDRSMERWGGMSATRRANLLTNNYSPSDGSFVGAKNVLTLPQPKWTNPGMPAVDSWYTAPPGCSIGKISGTWDWFGLSASAQLDIAMILATDTLPSVFDATTNLDAAGPAAVTVTATTADRRFAVLTLSYAGTNGTDDSVTRSVEWSNLAVVGTHGIAQLTPDQIVQYVLSTWCPGITYDASTIQAHPFEFQHFVAEKMSPADIIAQANSVANWDFGVRGDEFYFRQGPLLTEPDFILDIEQGDELIPNGLSMSDERPVNRAKVFYTDSLTDRAEVITWADDYRLRIDDDQHPCNRENRNRYLIVDIGGPCDEDQAIQVGSMALAEQQVPSKAGKGKAVGMVTAADGSKVPAYHIQEGDVIRYAHESIGRQVQSLTYDPITGTVDIEFDDRPASLKAMLARQDVALTVAGGK